MPDTGVREKRYLSTRTCSMASTKAFSTPASTSPREAPTLPSAVGVSLGVAKSTWERYTIVDMVDRTGDHSFFKTHAHFYFYFYIYEG